MDDRVQKMLAKNLLKGDRVRSAILAYIQANPSHTNDQIGAAVGVSGRQVKRHLKLLVEAGVVQSTVTYVRGLSQVLTKRKIVVQSVDGHCVPESQVGSEADDGEGTGTAGNHPVHPQDLQ